MKKYVLGIDIGGSMIKIGCFDLAGQLLEKWTLLTDTTNQGSLILPTIAHFIKQQLNQDEILAIGVGVPGIVQKGIAITCVNLGWEHLDVKETLHSLMENRDIQIEVANDASLAALGEYYDGAGKGSQNLILLTLGTGIGGGVIIDGKILEGSAGFAGEFGHIVVDFDRRLACKCGKSGCLETVASATGMVRLAMILLQENSQDSLLRTYPYLNAKRIFECAISGDILANEVVEEAAKKLGYMFSILALSFNPDVFILGGGVANAGSFFLEKIMKHFHQFVIPLLKDSNFRLASLGNDAGMVGACRMVM